MSLTNRDLYIIAEINVDNEPIGYVVQTLYNSSKYQPYSKKDLLDSLKHNKYNVNAIKDFSYKDYRVALNEDICRIYLNKPIFDYIEDRSDNITEIDKTFKLIDYVEACYRTNIVARNVKDIDTLQRYCKDDLKYNFMSDNIEYHLMRDTYYKDMLNLIQGNGLPKLCYYSVASLQERYLFEETYALRTVLGVGRCIFEVNSVKNERFLDES